uniref:AB hydrolase-1 domain-containing protein n=1 Tax=Fagus sylvatica TaxID=28930 RepID=A0A2N9GDK3_FAGSY
MGENNDSLTLKPHLVLVHGISGGGWCWYKIRCLMENSGYRVSCVDLKSAGIDQTSADSLLSFDDYNKPLLDFMSALPDNEQATHKFPKKIRLAVYVAATMLKLGYMSDEDLKDTAEQSCREGRGRIDCQLSSQTIVGGVPDLSEFGDVYDFGFGLGPDQNPTSALVKKEFQRKIIYHLSPHEDSTLAAMLLRPGPITAILNARFVAVDVDHNVDKVPRIYIKTVHDRVVKPEQQAAMIKRWPPSDIYVLDSDHSPFFSTPFLLFGLLVKAIASNLD